MLPNSYLVQAARSRRQLLAPQLKGKNRSKACRSWASMSFNSISAMKRLSTKPCFAMRVRWNIKTIRPGYLRFLVDIIVHTASSSDPRLVSHLIKALGQRRKVSKEKTYFIHVSLSSIFSPDNSLNPSQSSVATIFSVEGGWAPGEVMDTDPLFKKQKEMGGAHPVRVASHLSFPYPCIVRIRLLIL